MVSRYSMRTSTHAHLLRLHNVVLFLFPGELDRDQRPNVQYKNVDDTRLGKYHMTTMLYYVTDIAQYYDTTKIEAAQRKYYVNSIIIAIKT